MRRHCLSFMGPIALVSYPVAAGDGLDCGIYDGKPVKVDSLPNIAKSLTFKKSEFETSAEFQVRRERERRKLGALKVIRVAPAISEPVRPKFFADQGVVGFSILGWGLEDAPLSSIIPQADWSNTRWMDDKNAFPFHVGYTAVANGSFVASNVFGASVRIRRETTASNYFIHRGRNPSEWIWIIPYSATEARSVVGTYKPAIVIDISEGEGFTSSNRIQPAMDFPYDVQVNTSVVSGQFVCGLYYDAKGIVRAVFDPDVIEDASTISAEAKQPDSSK